jgi:hypothetical protein
MVVKVGNGSRVALALPLLAETLGWLPGYTCSYPL